MHATAWLLCASAAAWAPQASSNACNVAHNANGDVAHGFSHEAFQDPSPDPPRTRTVPRPTALLFLYEAAACVVGDCLGNFVCVTAQRVAPAGGRQPGCPSA